MKAIKMILKDGKLDVLPPDAPGEGGIEERMIDGADQRVEMAERTGGLAIDIVPNRGREPEAVQESREDKSRRLQWLLQQLIRQTLQENNQTLTREIRESVVKELDYQFRMQEEREEARDRMLAERDEEHYKRMDELLRKKSRRLKKEKPEKGQDRSGLAKADLHKCDADMSEEGQPQPPGKKKRRFL